MAAWNYGGYWEDFSVWFYIFHNCEYPAMIISFVVKHFLKLCLKKKKTQVESEVNWSLEFFNLTGYDLCRELGNFLKREEVTSLVTDTGTKLPSSWQHCPLKNICFIMAFTILPKPPSPSLFSSLPSTWVLLKILFIYLSREWERQAEGEAGSFSKTWFQEPWSWPEPKAETLLTEPPRHP